MTVSGAVIGLPIAPGSRATGTIDASAKRSATILATARTKSRLPAVPGASSGQTEPHHIGDRPDKVAPPRGAGRVLEPNGADDPVIPAYRHGEQGPGAERAQ